MAILISTPQDLNNIRNNLSGDYELVNDIDMSAWGNFSPIGSSSTPFRGNINGNGYKIINMTINVTQTNVGLISYMETGVIQNLGFENANVTSNGNNYVGILAGYLRYDSQIINCYSTGQVDGQYGVGGLVGYHLADTGIISNSFSHANVTGKGRVGGILGNGGVNCLINKCYSTGLITVTPDPNLYNGGLVGSHSSVSSVTDSYYDTQTSGQSISAGGEGKTTAEMKTQSTYSGWDFNTVWGIDGDYPYLQVFGVPQAPANTKTINVQSNLSVINSSVLINKLSVKQLTTHTLPIQSVSNREITTSRNVESYLSLISTSVISSDKTVINGNRNVQSTIQPISSSIFRAVSVHRNLTSNLNAISCEINAFYPINVLSPNAYLTYVENVSRTFKMDNKSNAYYILNPSLLEVRK